MEFACENERKVQVIYFLDLKVALHEDMTEEINIHHKPTNVIAHPEHSWNNISSYNIAKRMMPFVPNLDKDKIGLGELQHF